MTVKNLRVALLQTTLQWESAGVNRLHFDQWINSLDARVDLIVLPEMFSSGFSMQVENTAECMDGASVSWMQNTAAATQAAICGSLAIRDGQRVFNRFVMAYPDGSLDYYDKRHLFRMAGEEQRYSAGNQRRILQWRGWRLCPMVCYDLRFPVWSRYRQDYDALIYVANWPAARRLHWRQLLIARAIENQCVVIGVNRVGVDHNGLRYCGDSMVIDAQGATILDPKDAIGAHIVSIDAAAVQAVREAFPVTLDADDFELNA